MTKSEVMAQAFRVEQLRTNQNEEEPGEESEHNDYLKEVWEVLDKRIPNGEDIKVCADFPNVNVECCNTCHTFYVHTEMDSDRLLDGTPVWICCSVKTALQKAELMAPPKGGLLSDEEAEELVRSIFSTTSRNE